MKIWMLLIVMMGLNANAQRVYSTTSRGSGPTYTAGPPTDISNARFLPRAKQPESPDPWRIMDGETNHIDSRWVSFYGMIVEVQPNGVRIDNGIFHSADGKTFYNGEFFIEHYPYVAAENEAVSSSDHLVALPAGVYTYTTVLGGTRTIRKLDYGIVWTPPAPPPPTPEQIAAAKAAAEKKKSAAVAATVKYNLEQADAGDAFNQLRMGERYLKGDGVEKDTTKARKYLEKSAAQGNDAAADLLKSLK